MALALCTAICYRFQAHVVLFQLACRPRSKPAHRTAHLRIDFQMEEVCKITCGQRQPIDPVHNIMSFMSRSVQQPCHLFGRFQVDDPKSFAGTLGAQCTESQCTLHSHWT